MITPDAVPEAAARLAGVAHRTPVQTCRSLDEVAGRRLFLKCENFQKGGAFKFRGAFNTVAQLDDAARARGVVTHSSGNHAQGLALAARLLGVDATIVMPHDAPHVKRAATVAYGAHIVECDAADRERVCGELLERTGATLVHPYDDDRIIAGQGTAALELLADVPQLDVLVAPVGGGGLLSGTALARASAAAECRVVGVEPAVAADAGESFRSGSVVSLPAVPDTIADGLRVRHIGQRNLDVMRRFVDEMVTVEEDEIVAALRLVWTRAKLVIEPSAAVAVAAVLAGRGIGTARRVGVILSGGNVSGETIATALSG